MACSEIDCCSRTKVLPIPVGTFGLRTLSPSSIEISKISFLHTKKTFTADVWSGKHEYIWPGTKDHSPQYALWRDRMEVFQEKFDIAIAALKKQLARNLELKNEANALRNQLFSGTSVLESRKSVEISAVTILQGHNTKLLTLVTVFFLPAIFVGTIFGMTNMPSQGSHRSFAITMVSVCLPVYLLIGSLNATAGLEFWRNRWYQFVHWCSNLMLRILRKKQSSGETSQKIGDYYCVVETLY